VDITTIFDRDFCIHCKSLTPAQKKLHRNDVTDSFVKDGKTVKGYYSFEGGEYPKHFKNFSAIKELGIYSPD